MSLKSHVDGRSSANKAGPETTDRREFTGRLVPVVEKAVGDVTRARHLVVNACKRRWLNTNSSRLFGDEGVGGVSAT